MRPRPQTFSDLCDEFYYAHLFIKQLPTNHYHEYRGTYGQMFGFNIRFVQFDYIVYYGFSMSLNASTGWLEVLDPIQEATMWILTSFVLALILTMVFLLGYIVFSFSTNLFTVGLVPSTILRRLGKSILYISL